MLLKIKEIINRLGYYTYTKLYNHEACPILDYCSEVWGFKQFKQIETNQHKAIRIFLGVHIYAHLQAIDGDMSLSSCDTRRKVAMFIYWNRLIDMDDSRLQKHVFKWDVDLGFINS